MILKIGGSVSEKLSLVIDTLKEVKPTRSLIVPGGWIFADMVRQIDRKIGLDPSAAHWMAIASMDIYGYYISNFGIPVFEPASIDDLKDLKGVRVLLLYHLLKKLDDPDLPHSWDVTSDSIAVWLAAKLGEKTVVKVTEVGGIISNGELVEEIMSKELVGMESCIDRHTPFLLRKYGINMFVCRAEEIKSYILRGQARGTLIKGR